MAIRKRPSPAVLIASGRLHLHHIGPGVGQQPGAEGRRGRLCILNDPHSREGSRTGIGV